MKSVYDRNEPCSCYVGHIKIPESLSDWFGYQELLGDILHLCLPQSISKNNPSRAYYSRAHGLNLLNVEKLTLSKMLVPSILVYSYCTGQYSSTDIIKNSSKEEGLTLLLNSTSITDVDLRNFRRVFREDFTCKLYETLLMLFLKYQCDSSLSNRLDGSIIPGSFKKNIRALAVERVQRGILMDHMFLDN